MKKSSTFYFNKYLRLNKQRISHLLTKQTPPEPAILALNFRRRQLEYWEEQIRLNVWTRKIIERLQDDYLYHNVLTAYIFKRLISSMSDVLLSRFRYAIFRHPLQTVIFSKTVET